MKKSSVASVATVVTRCHVLRRTGASPNMESSFSSSKGTYLNGRAKTANTHAGMTTKTTKGQSAAE